MTPENQILLDAILRRPHYPKPIRLTFKSDTIDSSRFMEIIQHITGNGSAEVFFVDCVFSDNCALGIAPILLGTGDQK